MLVGSGLLLLMHGTRARAGTTRSLERSAWVYTAA
jgi:hypothetical protein